LSRLADFFHRLILAIQPFAERLGGPGLLLVAFLDSSFVSLPEVGDALIVLLVLEHPSRWLYYGVMTTIGSAGGCFALYSVARKGGEAFLRRRFNARNVERGLAVYRRYGLLALIVPSILPPPTPFKIFVLLAGVANVSPGTFVFAIVAGRGFRYIGEAWLAREYGEQAKDFIQHNLATASLWLAAAVAVLGIAVIVWRRRSSRAAASS
jgi:membrane protein YqaA with SNARE-associated domain